MGFFSFIKKMFSGSADEAALNAARARHAEKADAEQKAGGKKNTTEAERFAKDFDTWEELKHLREDYFFGKWASRKIHPIGEDKVKKELADLEKKRKEEGQQKGGV